MPDEDGRFTQEDNARITDWFKEKWKRGYSCPICAVQNWGVEEYLANAPIVHIPRHSFAPPELTGRTYPFVLVICNNCGYTMFLNAVSIGVSKPAQDG